MRHENAWNTKILVVEPLGDGGIAHYTYNLVSALIALGVWPLLWTAHRYEFSHKSWPQDCLRKSLFRIAFGLVRIFPGLDSESGIAAVVRRIIKMVEYPFNAVEAMIVARTKGIKIVHLQTVNSVDLIVVLIARAFGMRVVTTVHNVNPLHGKMTGPHYFLLKRMYDLSSQLIIHTDAGANEIQELFGVEAEKISVIPHGDYSFFVSEQADEKCERSYVAGPQDLLFFGAIRPNKGLDLMLNALPKIRQQHPESRLIIVGEPVGGYDPYRNIIERLGLSGAVVEILEYVENEEVAAYFQAAAVAVLPYREITQSGVVQIAFACGTPIVAADLAGFCEVIENNVSGLLYATSNVEALSDACCEMLADPERASKMGNEARLRMQRDYSWEKIAERTENEVYGQLV